MRKLYWSNLWTIFGIVAFLFWPWDNSHAIRVKTKWADRVKEAQIVARGVVLSVQSYWNPEKTMIYTENRISIKEYLKGSGPEEITLLIPGGKVGEDVLTVSDVPRFREGEHVVLTLEDLERVVGGPDGVFRLASKPEDLPKAARGRDGLFLQWLKDFLEGKTETTFEELIQEGSQLAPYPKAAITEVTPSEVSAGTGETITIRGSGFGLAPGSPGPGIAFRYYQNDYYWDSSFVRSWSDSEVVMEVWEKEIDAYSYVPGSWPNTVGFVNPSGTISPTWPLIVKFGYGKAKWPSPVVSYKLNVSQGPPGASDAIKRAANSWSDADSPFRFEFGGDISSCDYPRFRFFI